MFVPGDVSHDPDIEKLYKAILDAHGRLDVSIHNAGIVDPRDESVVKTPREFWDRVLAVNLTGVFLSAGTRSPSCWRAKGQTHSSTSRRCRPDGRGRAPGRLHREQGGVLAMTREIAVR